MILAFYIFSHVFQIMNIFKDLNSYKYALKAADKLKNRFIENPGFIQAFGAIPPEKN